MKSLPEQDLALDLRRGFAAYHDDPDALSEADALGIAEIMLFGDPGAENCEPAVEHLRQFYMPQGNCVADFLPLDATIYDLAVAAGASTHRARSILSGDTSLALTEAQGIAERWGLDLEELRRVPTRFGPTHV